MPTSLRRTATKWEEANKQKSKLTKASTSTNPPEFSKKAKQSQQKRASQEEKLCEKINQAMDGESISYDGHGDRFFFWGLGPTSMNA